MSTHAESSAPQPIPALGESGRVILRFAGVSIRKGAQTVFRHTDWSWHAGQQWAILGRDGSGKSLLVQALLGRAPLVAGEIQGPYGGASGQDEADPEQVIGLVSPEIQRQILLHESSFYQARWHSGLDEGERTVAQFLSQDNVEGHNPFEVNPRRGSVEQFARERRRWVATLNLRPLWDRRLAHLSNGELRKTLLVHALLRRPRLLVLEDAYAGLDVVTRRALGAAVGRLQRLGLPVLVVTHRAEDIPARATHIVWADRHRIAGQGPKKEILRRWRERAREPNSASSAAARSTPRPLNGARGATEGGRRPPVFELRNVTIVGDGKTILHDITWTVGDGERWLLLGPNGAGKSTLLNLIQGDHPQAYARDIKLFGRTTDTTQTLWQSRQQIGWMSPELHQHYPTEWPALEVVASGFFNTLGLFQALSRSQRTAARRWLRNLGLERQAQTALGDLAFGQQRLVLLARAVVKRPRLLILDEPTQGMDAGQRFTLLKAVDRVVDQLRCALVFVTHHPQEIPRCLRHVLNLRQGRVTGASYHPKP